MSPRVSLERIAVFRALYLGDLLCAVPAIRSLRQTFPSAQIDLIGLSWSKTLVSRFSDYLDNLVEFPGYPGLPEQPVHPQRTVTFIQQMQAEPYDLVLQMHGDGSIINPLMMLFGAGATAGFYQPGSYCPNPETYIPYPEGIHEIHRMLALTRHLGFVDTGDYLEFPVFDADRLALAQSPAADLTPGQYICIHPGSRGLNRRASPALFAQIGDIYAQAGYRVVLTGVAEEKPLLEAVIQNMTHPALLLAGETSLGMMAALLEKCHLLIANDTGVSHIAAALQVPSVILFSASDPARWAPLNHELHYAIDCNDGVSLDRFISSLALSPTL
jgi:ADP-heptose:LPS heptosyltransferase